MKTFDTKLKKAIEMAEQGTKISKILASFPAKDRKALKELLEVTISLQAYQSRLEKVTPNKRALEQVLTQLQHSKSRGLNDWWGRFFRQKIAWGSVLSLLLVTIISVNYWDSAPVSFDAVSHSPETKEEFPLASRSTFTNESTEALMAVSTVETTADTSFIIMEAVDLREETMEPVQIVNAMTVELQDLLAEMDQLDWEDPSQFEFDL
jgi:hypothetical protein